MTIIGRGALSSVFGEKPLEIQLHKPTEIATVLDILEEVCPEFTAWRDRVHCILNSEVVEPSSSIYPRAVLELMPADIIH